MQSITDLKVELRVFYYNADNVFCLVMEIIDGVHELQIVHVECKDVSNSESRKTNPGLTLLNQHDRS